MWKCCLSEVKGVRRATSPSIGNQWERERRRSDMMNFRKISAASKGLLILRYFTENKPEASPGAGVAAAGRDLETGGRMTAYYTGQDDRAMWRPDMPKILAEAIGVDANPAAA